VIRGGFLNGEKPRTPPMQQPTGIEFVLNLNAAKLLGLTIPLALLDRANEVIE
jgi:putative ABC transport system substrate-binding protein